jgi:hypothetical protein
MGRASFIVQLNYDNVISIAEAGSPVMSYSKIFFLLLIFYSIYET